MLSEQHAGHGREGENAAGKNDHGSSPRLSLKVNQTEDRAYAPPIAISERRVDVVEPGQNLRRWKLEFPDQRNTVGSPYRLLDCMLDERIAVVLGRTSKMSHASGRRDACFTTFLILQFHFGHS